MPYEGGNRVPLIVKWPDVTKAGKISDCPVNNIDFFSTFQMYLEGKIGDELDGTDIYPLLSNENLLLKEIYSGISRLILNRIQIMEKVLGQSRILLCVQANGN